MNPDCKPYVDAALALLESSHDGVISTGQVACYVRRACGGAGRLDAHVSLAEEALANCGLFWPCIHEPRMAGVALWRLKPADWRVSA